MEVAKLNEVIVRQYILAGSIDTDFQILESLSENKCDKDVFVMEWLKILILQLLSYKNLHPMKTGG